MQLRQLGDAKNLLDICFGENAWSSDMLYSQLEKPESRCTVAVDGDTLVGFLAFEQIADEGSVIEVAVHPDYRRQGIARALIMSALDDADGLCVVFLEVRESNRAAIALYESLGFEKLGVRKDYYRDPKENGIIYRLPLVKEAVGSAD